MADMNSIIQQALIDEGMAGTDRGLLAYSIFGQESGFGKNTKTSNHGTVGVGQMLPATFNSVADKGWDINDPYYNARAAARYINQLYNAAGGDLRLTAIGYYGGPGAIKAAQQGIYYKDRKNPNAPDTAQYADQVLNRMAKLAGGRAYVASVDQTDKVPSSQGNNLPDIGGSAEPQFGAVRQPAGQRARASSIAAGLTQQRRTNIPQHQTFDIAKAMQPLQEMAKDRPEIQNLFNQPTLAAPITFGGQPALAIPTSEEEKALFAQVNGKNYSERQKDNVIRAYAQIAPAHRQLMGKNLFNSNNITDLDGYLKDLVENA
ncbi:hypothetical protein V757_02215 [Pelistega indica]|uniref:Transglycosylase SLT domain-containing protein n=1 Tax=Pelistega indica TaxID=1414851 RepID=V8G8M7_9BURK|nr:lytic transglycosylase domain-containing protein [Pelistega indica]ETD72775.1 hypothetical protein V757_02215 [Pelistega indica]